jgi:hypothetical protein
MSPGLVNLTRAACLVAIAALSACPVTAAAQEESMLPPGLYRLEMIMASTTRVPLFGSSKSASKSVSLVEIRRDSAGLVQNHRVCDFRVLEDSKMIKMIFPEKFIAALAKHSYPVQLEKDAQGWSFVLPFIEPTINFAMKEQKDGFYSGDKIFPQ